MYTVLTFVHVFLCTFLIIVVLLQAGKGGGMGIAFGGGGSQTVFGGSGAGNFLTRMTAIVAMLFFANSLILAYMSSQSDSKRLQTLSQKKAAEKDAQKALNDKLAKDIEKAKTTTPAAPGTPESPEAAKTAPVEGAKTTPGITVERVVPGEKPATKPEGAGKPEPKSEAAPEAPAKPKKAAAPKAEKPAEEKAAAPAEEKAPPAPANP